MSRRSLLPFAPRKDVLSRSERRLYSRCSMRIRCFMLAFAGYCSLTIAVAANDWPQWRGPERTGISKETGLLKEWPADGPKLLWQAKDIGDGYSTPAVVGDRLYVISN